MGRWAHVAILTAVVALLTLPHLGTSSLWDIDEGLNAEAAREMLEGDHWIVPTFNFELRTAKPALLYWLQMASYSTFGVSEFAARLPSVLCALIAVLATYWLTRRMFDPPTALLAGIVLASAVQFTILAHAATPDMLLLATTTLALLAFWTGYTRTPEGRGWFVPFGLATGLAVMAKGPVGLVLPSCAVGLYLLWCGELRRLLDRRLGWGLLAVVLVAAPWYILVGIETRGEFLRAFLGHDNVRRAMQPLENHGGPAWYYLPVVLVGLAPWSAFLVPAGWQARQDVKPDAETRTRQAVRLLLAWVAAYLLCFSVIATKLPSYVLPIYPALAILTARVLERWRTHASLPGWFAPWSLVAVCLVGMLASVGLAVAGGSVPLASVRQPLAGLQPLVTLGMVLVGAAMLAGWFGYCGQRSRALATVVAGCISFVGILAAFAGLALESHKGPRALVEESGALDRTQEIRLAAFDYFQPSLVFYSQREIRKLNGNEQAAEFLRTPLPAYLFVSVPAWERLQPLLTTPTREVARRYDLYRRCEVVVITNR